MISVRRKPVASIGLLIAAGFSACVYPFNQESQMVATDNKLALIAETTRPVCFGRFVVDVPTTAEVIFGPARLPDEIWRKEGEGKALDDVVKRAVEKSEKDKRLATDGLLSSNSMLGKVINGIAPNHKIVFGVSKGDGAFYSIQSIFSVGPDLFVQEYVAFGDNGKYLEAVKDAKVIASQLRSRGEYEIPVEPGICLDGAFVAEPYEYTTEAVSLGIRLKEFNDVHISIEVTKKSRLVESDALEPRVMAGEKEAIASGNWLWYQQIKFLRKSQRKIGDWDGFEVAVRKPARKEEEASHEFVYLSQGEPKNALLPVLDIQLHTGVKDNRIGAAKTSITDAEALYLWDKVISSIRPRPLAVQR